jgi:hypothetical protein
MARNSGVLEASVRNLTFAFELIGDAIDTALNKQRSFWELLSAGSLVGTKVFADTLKNAFAPIGEALKELFGGGKTKLGLLDEDEARRAEEQIRRLGQEMALASAKGSSRLLAEERLRFEDRLAQIEKLKLAEDEKRALTESAEREHETSLDEIRAEHLAFRADLDLRYRQGDIEAFIAHLQSKAAAEQGALAGMQSLMQSYQQLWSVSFQNIRGAFIAFVGDALTTFSSAFGQTIVASSPARRRPVKPSQTLAGKCWVCWPSSSLSCWSIPPSWSPCRPSSVKPPWPPSPPLLRAGAPPL